MSYLIDGHNLIGVLPDIQLSDPDDELQLLARLRSFRSRHTGHDIIVFFDSSDVAPGGRRSGLSGAMANLSGPGLRVRFSKPGQTADDAIVAFLRSSAASGQYAVVTDDQELARRVRFAGASRVSAGEFAAKLRRDVTARRGAAAQPGTSSEHHPDPRDPAYADIYAGFISADKTRGRLPNTEHADPAAWVERLYSADVAEAERAARWLGQHGGKAALGPLRDALTHADARVRAAALLAFGDLGNPAVVPDLCERLSQDSNAMARQAAAQSLARVGDKRAEAALEAAAKSDAKGKVRKAAHDALAQIRARRG